MSYSLHAEEDGDYNKSGVLPLVVSSECKSAYHHISNKTIRLTVWLASHLN